MENFFAQTDTKEAKESSNETKDKDSRDLQENMMIEELMNEPKRVKLVNKCPHPERKHCAKNMCSSCYRKYGREKKAYKCPHSDRSAYSKGLCQYCYLKDYHRRKHTGGQDKSEDESHDDLVEK